MGPVRRKTTTAPVATLALLMLPALSALPGLPGSAGSLHAQDPADTVETADPLDPISPERMDPGALPGDTVELSLPEVVRLAVQESDEVRMANTGIDLAEAQVTSVRSAALPQISANLGYTRTFASLFDTGEQEELPDSLIFEPDTTAPLAERVRYLERQVPTAAIGGIGQLFGDLPFGRENAYNATISGSQLLYSGGRVGTALDIARNFRELAGLNRTEQVAEIELQVRTAYVQALLAREMEAAAVAALEQAQAFLEQEELRLESGQASELDVLRAQVDRDNLRPQVVQARNAADIALLDVKRLTDVPMGAPIRLTSSLEAPDPDLAEEELRDEVLLAQRASLLAAQEQIEIRRGQVDIARAAYLPNVALQMSYGRQLLPEDVFGFDADWRTDWSATVGVQIPIFEGLRRGADVDIARAELEQARLQFSQLREAVQLQYQQALGEKRRALAAIEAREATVGVAERVYELTELRYDQGLSTQLEVSDARLALLQARTNLAQAIADYYVADAGLVRAGVPGADAAGAAGAADGMPPVPETPTPDTPQTPATGTPTPPDGNQ